MSDLAAKDVGRITSATLDLTCKAPGLTVVTPEPVIEPTTTPFPEVTPQPDALKPEELDVKYQVWVPVVISMDGNGSTDDPMPTGNP